MGSLMTHLCWHWSPVSGPMLLPQMGCKTTTGYPHNFCYWPVFCQYPFHLSEKNHCELNAPKEHGTMTPGSNPGPLVPVTNTVTLRPPAYITLSVKPQEVENARHKSLQLTINNYSAWIRAISNQLSALCFDITVYCTLTLNNQLSVL